MFTNITNPVWANEEHTAIDCTAIHEKYGHIPFTASQNDCEEYGRALFNALAAGEYGPVADYVPPVFPSGTATASSGNIPQSVL